MTEPLPRWGWQNIGRGLDARDKSALQTLFFRSDAPVEFYRSVCYSAAGLILAFAGLAQLGQKYGFGKYRSLDDGARLTMLCHIAFFSIFVTTTAPFSIALIKIFYSPMGPLYILDHTVYRSIAYPVSLQLAMYALEGGIRAVINRNYFLVAHHLVFNILTVLAFQAESLYMIYIDIIFSCFATYEFCLYAALIARKVEALHVHFRWLFVTGLTLYGLTRALQTALLISLFVFAYEPMSHASEDRALYWVGLVLSGGLLALQLWTFVIYRAIWQSTKAKLGFNGMHLPKTIQLSKKRPADKPQELKTEMARADTNSVELSPAVYAQSITEYPRSNILSTAGSTDLLSSQTLLLPVDEIQGMLSSGFASNLDSNNAMPRPPYDTSHKTQSSAR